MVGLPKKELRLQFTEEERISPELGKAVKKAEKAPAEEIIVYEEDYRDQ